VSNVMSWCRPGVSDLIQVMSGRAGRDYNISTNDTLDKEIIMTPIGLFYGSNTGFTALVAKMIEEEFDSVATNLVTLHDVAEEPLERILDYELLIIGCPTWNEGHLQDDWDNEFLTLEELDL